jgi:hypothetical protein
MRQHTTRWRALGLALLGLALALVAACGNSATGPSYDPGAGRIVVQRFTQPGFVAQAAPVPTWTLYGDGTLVFATGGVVPGSSQLAVAKLSQSDVQRILDVIVNQHHFFASTKPTYGRVVPDIGATRLTVNANGQSKSVELFLDPGATGDAETRNVFAIAQYLQDYNPPNPTPYVAPGVALLVNTRSPVSVVLVDPAPLQWPYADVDLSQAYALSCGYFHNDADCTGPSGTQAKVMGVYGSRAQDILALSPTRLIHAQQGAYVYTISVYPLLPDALVSQNGQAPGVLVNPTVRLQLQPAPPTNG